MEAPNSTAWWTVASAERRNISLVVRVGTGDRDLRQILLEDPTRGVRILTIHHLCDDVSAEMATYYFGEFLRPPIPESDLEEDEAQQERLREIGLAIRDYQEIGEINPEMFSDTTHLARYQGDVPFTRFLAGRYAPELGGDRLASADEPPGEAASP